MAVSSLLSVVVPVFNEEEVLPEFHRRLVAVLAGLPQPAEIIYVDDGSSDNSLGCLYALQEADRTVGIVSLSRNFGKEAALTAGLRHADGDAVVVIDADLQDPPELIPEMVSRWQQGFDVVYARRTARDGESMLKKLTAYAFYRIAARLCSVHIPPDTGDFRLLSRRAVDSLLQLDERHRFMKGLFAWVGFRQTAVEYRRDPRQAGCSKWNYWKLWNFAIEGITSFTTMPLKVSTYLGGLIALGAFVYGTYIVADTLLHGNPVPGYPSLMVVMLFLGGGQLIALGIIGEYLGRMFDETKRRPLYVVSEFVPPHSAGISPTDQLAGSEALLALPRSRRSVRAPVIARRKVA